MSLTARRGFLCLVCFEKITCLGEQRAQRLPSAVCLLPKLKLIDQSGIRLKLAPGFTSDARQIFLNLSE